MQSLIEFLGQNHVILFLLLFARLSGLFAFFPFFSHMRIPMSVKTAMVLFMAVFLFPQATLPNIDFSVGAIALAIVSEIMLGFIAGIFLLIVFAILQMAGMQVSFIMGFTMASVMDPQSGTSMPIISTFFTLVALVVMLAFNGHHMMIMFIVESLKILPLGDFYPNHGIWDYLVHAVSNMFIFGFILSFPIVGLSLLADIVFGMLMKTMPQFNLLVVGFPIKIMVALIVLIAVLTSIMLIFKREFLEAIEKLTILFI
ncbi:flagellar biosynthetic protein FliR [Sulfurospirillum arcachonense]|uniref:flagellar biosynthetic protein FliR n=1 Tax=Sulfurospirillum arcachonense TaxID=57666 RepID=UPI000468604B|nr:flagellar biosynthetic protein FliR [Sulfurospirillum arcachonense]